MKIYEHPGGKIHKVNSERKLLDLSVTQCGYRFNEKFEEENNYVVLPKRLLCERCFGEQEFWW